MKHCFPFLFLLFSCTTSKITYIDDTAFLQPAIANSPEELVSVNSHPCIDIEGLPGMCSLRVFEGSTIDLTVSGKPYPFQLSISCSDAVKFDKEISVEAKTITKLIIPVPLLEITKSFTCIGEIYPQDRSQQISSKFELRVKIIDKNYEVLETPRIISKEGNTYVVVGKYALHTFVKDNGIWKYYFKDSIVKVSGNKLIIMTESFSGRKSFFKN